tara:strand:+ start:416 stop:580 length:165 start_codon:yes stop_codon:yes gene_type:complete
MTKQELYDIIIPFAIKDLSLEDFSELLDKHIRKSSYEIFDGVVAISIHNGVLIP